jgi:CsoR family transcriptional regulator, copper-sensing transcriptional repressor
MDSQTKAKVLGRLRRIEGQVQGIQRMVEEEKPGVDVLLQVAAVRGALDQVQKLLLGQLLEGCVAEALRAGNARDRQRRLEELQDIVARYAGR